MGVKGQEQEQNTRTRTCERAILMLLKINKEIKKAAFLINFIKAFVD